jgi:hypothetical protein
MEQRGTNVASNDAMSFPGEPLIWTVILETIFLQQDLGLSADKKVHENSTGNKQIRGNLRGSIPYPEIYYP